MAAGQQAVQQGHYANAERIFLVVVSLSQLAQGYAAKDSMWRRNRLYLKALKIYQTVHGDFTPLLPPRSTTWWASIACTASMPRRSHC